MSRQEVTNTFTKGMIMDLHPINTPNEVLTDCVNGTLITYDGNEYTLQNEKGNYLLKNCKLPEHYIPVGLREYGDILYIVSYNPLDRRVEIGSYPSPKSIEETGNNNPLDSIKIEKSACNYDKYSEIVKEYEKLSVFYGDIPDNYKLNPGDQYEVTLTGWTGNLYEALELYAIDEERKTYLLGSYRPYNGQDFLEGEDSLIEIKDSLDYIKWQVPGWLGVKPRFAYIDDFKVNVRKIYFSNYTSVGKLALNFQLTTSDKIFTNLETPCNELGAELLIKISNSEGEPKEYPEDIILNSRVDLKNGSHIYYANFPTEGTPDVEDNLWGFDAENDSKITITVKPYINACGKIYYNEYERTLTFDVSKKGDVEDFIIGAESWRYGTYNDEKKFTLTFETGGLEATSVLNSDVFLFYNIYSLSRGLILEGQQCTNWVMIGETTMEIDLEEYTEQDSASPKFVAEDIYVFEFKFYSSDSYKDEYYLDKTIYKLVVASELMNKFVDEGVSNFEDITFDQWISGYEESVKNKNIKDFGLTTDGKLTEETEVVPGNGYNTWIADSGITKYKHFIDQTIYNTNLKKGITVSCGGTFEGNVKFKTDIQLLFGPLWDTLLDNSSLKLKLNTDVILNTKINQFTGKSEISETGNNKIEGSIKLEDTYILEPLNNNVCTIYDIIERPLNTNTYSWYKNEATGEFVINLLPSNSLNTRWLKSIADKRDKNNEIAYIKINSSSYTQPDYSSASSTDFKLPAVTRLITSLGDYDIVFLELHMRNEDTHLSFWNRWIHSRINIGETEMAYVNSQKTDGPTVYVAAFPVTYGSQTVLSIISFEKSICTNLQSCLNSFNTCISRLRRIECGSEQRKGGFYEAIKDGESKLVQKFDGEVSGSVSLKNFSYNNKNMWVEAERVTLVDKYESINKNNLLTSTLGTSSKFSTIALLYSNIETSFNEEDLESAEKLLEEFEKSILDINEEINKEFNNYQIDTDITSFNPGNVFIIDTGNKLSGSNLLDNIAKKRIKSNPFNVAYNFNTKDNTYDYFIGVCDEELKLE